MPMCKLFFVFLALAPFAFAELDVGFRTQPEDQAVVVGETVQFEAVSFDIEPYPDFLWDFGDGTQKRGLTTSHAFQEVGAYLVKLTPLDENGNQGEACYQMRFVNPTTIPRSQWYAHIDGTIVQPAEPSSVLQLGSQVRFEAQSNADVRTFFWHLEGTPHVFEGAVWDWTIPQSLKPDRYRLVMTAIHQDGTATPFPKSRSLFFYTDQAPIDSFLQTPTPDSDGVFRMQLGETLTFTGGSQPDADENTYRWDLEAYGSLAAGSCDNYSPENSGPFFGKTFQFTPEKTGFYCFDLTAMDPDQNSDPFPFEFQIIVKGDNQAPNGQIVTPSQTIKVNEELNLVGKGGDPDRDPIQFEWDLGNGSIVHGKTVNVAFPQAGAYKVQLTIIDSSGARDPTPFARWILVNDPSLEPINSEPFAAISSPFLETLVSLQTPLTVTGTGRDYDGDSVTLYWDMGNGTLFQGTDRATVAYETPGYVDVILLCRDAKGFAWRYSDLLSVFVYEQTKPPNGRITQPAIVRTDGDAYEPPNILIKPGVPLTLKGTALGVEDLTGYSARWSITNPDVNPRELEGFEPDPITFSESGSYHVGFRVSDPNGTSDPFEDFMYVDVFENFRPEGSIQEPDYDLGLRIGEGLTLSGFGTDEDQDPLCFEWQISDGRRLKGARLEDIRFSEPGFYKVSLTISDTSDASFKVPDDVYITIWPEDDEQFFYPKVNRIAPAEFRMTGPRNSQFKFEVGTSDPQTGETFTSFFWDFGNGQTATSASPGNIGYSTPGYYLTRLWVQGEDGLWSMYPETWETVIYGENLPPNGTITQPPLREKDGFFAAHTIPILIGQSLPLTATATDADGHFPLAVSWELDYETFSNQLEPDPLVFENRGTYRLSFNVRDNEDEEDPLPDFRIIQVVDPNLPPETYIVEPDGEITVEPGEEVFFFGFGEDPNDLEMTFEWNFGPLASPSTAQGEYVYPVVFNQETQPNEPILVTFKAKTEFTEDPTPAVIRVHVRSFQDSDFEPNDTLSQAMVIGQGSYSSLSLQGDDLADVYQFEITENSRDLEIELQAEDMLELNLYRFEMGQWQPLAIDGLRSGRDSLIVQNLARGRYALEFAPTASGTSKKRNISYGLSISTLQPSLYMPFAVEDGSLSSTIGLVNAAASDNDIAILGMDSKGAVIETKTMSLKPGQRLFQPTKTFFDRDGQVSKARQVRWIKVISTYRLAGFTNASTQDGTQLMSSAAINNLQASVLVPHIAADTNRWYTRAVLINASEKNQPLQFLAPTDQQPLEMLKTNHQTDFRFTDVFPENLPTWGQFSHTSGKSGLAGIEIFGRADSANQTAALEMIDGRRTNPNFTYIRNQIYFTHVAQDTTNFWTGIALINPNRTDAGYDLIGYDQNGAEVVRLDNQILAPGGKLLNTVAELFGPDKGIAWLLVEADNGVSGFQLFGDYNGKRMAGFPAANFATDHLIFPHLTQKANEWTGIAILNVGDQEVEVTLEALNDKGEVVASRQSSILPRTKSVALPQNLFPDGLPPEACYLQVRGNKKTLNGFEIFGSLLPNGGLGEVMAGLSAQAP